MGRAVVAVLISPTREKPETQNCAHSHAYNAIVARLQHR
jgi:hypothetical protein